MDNSGTYISKADIMKEFNETESVFLLLRLKFMVPVLDRQEAVDVKNDKVQKKRFITQRQKEKMN